MSKLLGAEMEAYLHKMNAEKESLIAKYMVATGLRVDEIVLVQRTDIDGIRFYPAPRDPQLDDIAPEIRRLKAKIGTLTEQLRQAECKHNFMPTCRKWDTCTHCGLRQ